MSQIAISWRARMGFVALCFAGVFAMSAMLIIRRYLAEQSDPATFNSGMAAGGDWFLELFLVALFLIPTFILALMIRDSETSYTKFAWILLGFGLSAPASMGILAIPAFGQTNSWIGSLALYRIFAFPMSLFGLAGFCVLAKFKHPRRLILYSLIIEVVTFILLLTMSKF
jgi:hypothetical protein